MKVPRRPLLTTLLLTLLWHAGLVLLASVIPLPDSEVKEDLRAAVINVLTALLPLAMLARIGGFRPAGLTMGPRNVLWLVPLLAVALAPAATTLSATAAAALSTIVLQLCLGFNEELMSRGLVQTLTAHLGAWKCAVWVGALFGIGHAFNAVFFGASAFDAGGQVLTALAGGFCFAAVRFHVLSLWPFVMLHATENALRDVSSDLPVAAELAIMAFLVALGCLALARLQPGQEEAVAL